MPLARVFIIDALIIGALTTALSRQGLAATVSVPHQYPTIQSAIDAVRSSALPNGTIIDVQPGVYAETLAISTTSQSMTIRGVGGATKTEVRATGFNLTALRIVKATGTLRIEGLTFTGGVSDNEGNGGGFTILESAPTLVACVFRNNAGLDGGGGVIIRSNPQFQNVTIQQNTARRFGGGLKITEGSRPVFVGTRIRSNQAGTGSAIGSGGAVHANDASPTFRSSEITNNAAKFAAGGVLHMGVFGSRYGVATLAIEDSLIQGNVVSRYSAADNPAEGGGAHVEDNAVAYVRRSRIIGNTAGSGGGLSLYRARVELHSSTVEGNTAADSQNIGGLGGGICASSNNMSTPLRQASSIYLHDTAIRNNTARQGGAILVSGDLVCGSSCAPGTGTKARLDVEDSLIAGNSVSGASAQGGGVRAGVSIVNVAHALVLGNSAGSAAGGSFGGGFLLSEKTTATISATTIADNSSVDVGGGLFVDNGASLTMTGSAIAGNSSITGGGIYVGGAATPGVIQATTIADNSNWQIHEMACGGTAPLFEYVNNNVTAFSGKLYKSTCTYQATTALQLNALPSGRARGNFSSTPSFKSFMAVPGIVSEPTGHTVLSWAVARPSGPLTISDTSPETGNFSTSAFAGTTAAAPGAYTLTGSSASGAVGPITVSVAVGILWGDVAAGDRPLPADYDGDGAIDLAVYRSTTGEWFVDKSRDGPWSLAWGAPALGDEAVPGDFDGDGKADLAVYRNSTGQWIIWRSGGQGYFVIPWGAPSLQDRPVPADYDGDGKTDIAIYRGTTGQWIIWRSGGQGYFTIPWGAPALQDRPVPEDYDGDGKADLAVYRATSGQWLIWRSGGRGYFQYLWGAPSLLDKPIPADYDGDGRADLAICRPGTGEWLYFGSATGAQRVAWGCGQELVPADYDGDGSDDVATWDGLWRYRP